MSDQDTTITADGLAQMLDQFKGSANLRLLAASYLDQAQALEDAIWPLLGERGLSNATGDRLDGIGAIFAVPRGGRSDTDYRLALQARLAVLQSRGTELDLLTVAQLVLQMAPPDYDFTEYFPKGVVIRPVDELVTVPLARTIGTALKQSVSAGTTMHFVYAVSSDTTTFTLSAQGAAVELSTTLGLAAVPTYGGAWYYDATSTLLAGLAAGYFRLNNTNPLLATEMYVHEDDFLATDRTAFLTSLSFDVVSIGVPPVQMMTLVTSSTDNGATFTLDIEVYDSTAALFGDTDLAYIEEYESGGMMSGVS